MIPSVKLLALFSALVTAQTTTLDVLFPVEGIKTVYGTVVSANPEVTTYALHCGDEVDNVQCHILGTQTVVYGPSTLSINYFFDGDEKAPYFSEDLTCAIKTEEAVCNIVIETENSAGKKVSTSLSNTDKNIETHMIPAIITEGVEKLDGKASETASSNFTSSAVVESRPANTPASPTPTHSIVNTNGAPKSSVHVAIVGLTAIAAAFLMA
ncbi:hypothetical protein ACHAPJ_011208 [Fusarium lateritium]